MKQELIGILGLKKTADETEIMTEVEKLVIELRGKVGYVSASVIQKMIRDGILKEDPETQSYYCRVSKDFMERYINR